ncbi:uncharacterized protein NECHADRAFT_85943 [Fusarium vanettenii 77-13-4]|uniref:Uncharacterized protein n=1 Tax=Fusarium vanettenii (strain ATCC MYA-4622 / CBS 123669 / FGSC 9596 / NRRL 45880 / 77-13-4) TaxID=660122 RepID=C7Z1W9_FUSV7|nr:uncharacterized protein NECHADRAFT_85943 [Fusarium vanettenii 77-13-4]EEU41899.1 predicted protein [Fusarium vanettenii 77-13-4]
MHIGRQNGASPRINRSQDDLPQTSEEPHVSDYDEVVYIHQAVVNMPWAEATGGVTRTSMTNRPTPITNTHYLGAITFTAFPLWGITLCKTIQVNSGSSWSSFRLQRLTSEFGSTMLADTCSRGEMASNLCGSPLGIRQRHPPSTAEWRIGVKMRVEADVRLATSRSYSSVRGLHETETESDLSQINQMAEELNAQSPHKSLLMDRTTPRKKAMSPYVHNNFSDEQASSQRNKLVSFSSPQDRDCEPTSTLGSPKAKSAQRLNTSAP